MRISDWSSDVCSSDLRRCTRATGRPSPTSSTAGWPRARQPADSAFAAPDAGSGRYSQPVQWGAIPVPRQLIGQAQLFVREAAADRKSVVSGKRWSVRVDFGGRRIIKKKTQKNTQTQ